MKDMFSSNSKGYARSRPLYSKELYDFIFDLCLNRYHAWDAGTGNGQVARELAKEFKEVMASDISNKQIAEAPALPNVRYMVCPAESVPLENEEMDLITVGQAIHWFDIEKFEDEAYRVLKPMGIFAYWGYGLAVLSDKSWNELFHRFYELSLPFWQPEREIVDSHYRTIQIKRFDMKFKSFVMKMSWNSDRLINYIRTWSAMTAMKKALGDDLLEPLLDHTPREFTASFPVFLYYTRKV